MKKGIVTVGIPTYNRSFGLERTLRQICNQTYQNLEILVSDNCSPDPVVKEILEEFALKDNRIRYVIQDHNIGLHANFKYVLANSNDTEFFMWAADDDEWDPRFIQTCVENIGENGTAMTGFYRYVRYINEKKPAVLYPTLGKDSSIFENLVFLTYSMPCHSIFYGVHRRETLLPLLDSMQDGIDDTSFIFTQAIKHGIVTMPKQLYYTAGIDGPNGYETKDNTEINVIQILLNYIKIILPITDITSQEKLYLIQNYIKYLFHFYVFGFNQSNYSEEEIKFARYLFELVMEFDVTKFKAK